MLSLQAIHFLHQCGVLLHYSDCQTELGRLYFLNPVWLCKLMARVITIPEVNPLVSNRGVSVVIVNTLMCITLSLVAADKSVGVDSEATRVPSEVYTGVHPIIGEVISFCIATLLYTLCGRFEVAFRHCPDELLIPSHLPKECPVIKLPASTPGGQCHAVVIAVSSCCCREDSTTLLYVLHPTGILAPPNSQAIDLP